MPYNLVPQSGDYSRGYLMWYSEPRFDERFFRFALDGLDPRDNITDNHYNSWEELVAATALVIDWDNEVNAAALHAVRQERDAEMRGLHPAVGRVLAAS